MSPDKNPTSVRLPLPGGDIANLGTGKAIRGNEFRLERCNNSMIGMIKRDGFASRKSGRSHFGDLLRGLGNPLPSGGVGGLYVGVRGLPVGMVLHSKLSLRELLSGFVGSLFPPACLSYFGSGLFIGLGAGATCAAIGKVDQVDAAVLGDCFGLQPKGFGKCHPIVYDVDGSPVGSKDTVPLCASLTGRLYESAVGSSSPHVKNLARVGATMLVNVKVSVLSVFHRQTIHAAQ